MAAILFRPLPENILLLLTSLIILLCGKIKHLHHGSEGQRSQCSGLESSKGTYSVTGGHFVSAITGKHTFFLTSLIIMLSGKIRHLHHGFQGKEAKPVGWKVQKALIVSLAAILYHPLPKNKLCLLRSFIIMLSGKIIHLHHGF